MNTAADIFMALLRRLEHERARLHQVSRDAADIGDALLYTAAIAAAADAAGDHEAALRILQGSSEPIGLPRLRELLASSGDPLAAAALAMLPPDC